MMMHWTYYRHGEAILKANNTNTTRLDFSFGFDCFFDHYMPCIAIENLQARQDNG